MLEAIVLISPPLLTLLGRMNPRPGKRNSKELHYHFKSGMEGGESRAYA